MDTKKPIKIFLIGFDSLLAKNLVGTFEDEKNATKDSANNGNFLNEHPKQFAKDQKENGKDGQANGN
jgi:hypothetical protein